MFLVVEGPTGIVAHAYASEIRPVVLMVFRLYVAEEHRGRGLGSTLVESLSAQVPTAGLIWLDVAAGNDRALVFYRRHGFRVIGESEADGLLSLRLERVVQR